VREGAVVDALRDVIMGSQAMKDLAEEPLDGGASTLRWSRAPARGARGSAVAFSDSLAMLSLWRGRGSGENECARVRRREPSFDFVPPGSTRNRPMGMDGRRLTDRVTAQVGGTTFLTQAHDEAWCTEHAVRERADDRFPFWAGFEL
jgi:hypothetical protein